MKKIVLVQPSIGYMDALRSAPSPPLGLLYAASRLVDRFEVELIDARLQKNLEGALEKALTLDTLFVGFSCHTGPMIAGALAASRFVKRVSEVPVVWGGVHASLNPEQTAADPAVDFCVVGEGEQTALELALVLENGDDPESVPGLVFFRDGELVTTRPRKLLEVERWSEPAYQLVDISKYLPLYGGRRSLFFQASRGCHRKCAYCYNVPFNRQHYRKLPSDQVIARLRRLKERTNFEDVYFVDDNFYVDLEWASRVAVGLDEMGLTWQLQGVDIGTLLHAGRDAIDMLARHGCRRVTIGVETGSNRMRRYIHKYGTRDDVIQAIGRLEGTGLLVFTSFLVGLPSETIQDIRETVNLAIELIDRFAYVRCSPFYCYTPFPGTESYQASLDAGFEPPASLSGWATVGSWDNFSWERRSGKHLLGRKFFEGLNMATMFLDHKAGDYSESRWLARLADLYRPLARLRAKHLFFNLMPERWLLHYLYDRLADRTD